MKQPEKLTLVLTKTESAGFGAAMALVKQRQDALAAAAKEAEDIALEIVTAHGSPKVRLGGQIMTQPREDGRSVMIYDPVVEEAAVSALDPAPAIEPIPVASANVIPINGAALAGA